MTRTTISLPDDLLERLRSRAAERRTSVTALVREAVEEKLAKEPPKGPRQLPRSLGIGDSGYRYTARESAAIRPKPRSWR